MAVIRHIAAATLAAGDEAAGYDKLAKQTMLATNKAIAESRKRKVKKPSLLKRAGHGSVKLAKKMHQHHKKHIAKKKQAKMPKHKGKKPKKTKKIKNKKGKKPKKKLTKKQLKNKIAANKKQIQHNNQVAYEHPLGIDTQFNDPNLQRVADGIMSNPFLSSWFRLKTAVKNKANNLIDHAKNGYLQVRGLFAPNDEADNAGNNNNEEANSDRNNNNPVIRHVASDYHVSSPAASAAKEAAKQAVNTVKQPTKLRPPLASPRDIPPLRDPKAAKSEPTKLVPPIASPKDLPPLREPKAAKSEPTKLVPPLAPPKDLPPLREPKAATSEPTKLVPPLASPKDLPPLRDPKAEKDKQSEAKASQSTLPTINVAEADPTLAANNAAENAAKQDSVQIGG